MSSEGVDLKKRRFLTASTAVVGTVGVGFAAVPFIASWPAYPLASWRAIQFLLLG